MGEYAMLVIGIGIGILVVLDGIYVVGAPPYGDEMQGYGIALLGIFVILVSYYVSRRN
ncbi:MAG: hypothetical protein WC342_01745 [Methanoregula sp.]|jgi:hypothetical protein